jgi:hypothetical protein
MRMKGVGYNLHDENNTFAEPVVYQITELLCDGFTMERCDVSDDTELRVSCTKYDGDEYYQCTVVGRNPLHTFMDGQDMDKGDEFTLDEYPQSVLAQIVDTGDECTLLQMYPMRSLAFVRAVEIPDNVRTDDDMGLPAYRPQNMKPMPIYVAEVNMIATKCVLEVGPETEYIITQVYENPDNGLMYVKWGDALYPELNGFWFDDVM